MNDDNSVPQNTMESSIAQEPQSQGPLSLRREKTKASASYETDQPATSRSPQPPAAVSASPSPSQSSTTSSASLPECRGLLQTSSVTRDPPPSTTTSSNTPCSRSLRKQLLRQSSQVGRSVVDFTNIEDLRQALQKVTVVDDGNNNDNNNNNVSQQNDKEEEKNPDLSTSTTPPFDWKLPVHDDEADLSLETPDAEARRLWVLKSFLMLDAQAEQAFDALTDEARETFAVDTSLISLVDLGRQFLFSSSDVVTQNQPTSRETPRNIAFCAHTILNKHNICIVKDTKDDDRFRNNDLVTQPPHLRFYAGVPLLSPEGYKLGTFCIESTQPRPQGLTSSEQSLLHAFAQRTMSLMVQRREFLQEQLLTNSRVQSLLQSNLKRHAATVTNLGGIVYSQYKLYHAAMKLFQESVRTLMNLEPPTEGAIDATTTSFVPTIDRQEEMAEMLSILSALSPSETNDGSEQLSAQDTNKKNVTDHNVDVDHVLTRIKELTGTTEVECVTGSGGTSKSRPIVPNCLVDGIPGLFASLQKGMSLQMPSADEDHSSRQGGRQIGLIFAEAFQVSLEEVEEDQSSNDGKTGETRPQRRVDYRNFIIPLNECSKATLFNMGLIQYHWNHADWAMQFFDLAASLSQANTPLAFDPVVLGCLNNMAQINLQYGRAAEAMELLTDALTRGNAALAALYDTQGTDPRSTAQADCLSRRLRRKLARTVMNMGNVHYCTGDLDASMVTCNDAMKLLHTTKFEDTEAAAAWYNMAVLYHAKGDRRLGIKYIDKFLKRAPELVGLSLQVSDAFFLKSRILFEIGDLYESLKPLNDCMAIRCAELGKNHPSVAECLCQMGVVYEAREEYDYALNALQGSLSIMRSQGDSSQRASLDAAQVLLELGRTYRMQGNLKASFRVYSEVATVASRLFGSRHTFIARIHAILGNLCLEQGDVDQSVRFFHDAHTILVEQGLAPDLAMAGDPLLVSLSPRMSKNTAPIA